MTQEQWILKFMKSHKLGITAKQAMDQYGVMRLASRISDLRQKGYKIEMEMVKVKNRRGETCRVARYRLVA